MKRQPLGILSLILLVLAGSGSVNSAQPASRSITKNQQENTPELILQTGHTQGITSLSFSPDGNLLASASNDKTVQLWEPLTGKHIFTYRRHSGWATSVAWSPDGTLIASASNDKTVHIWQAR